MLPSVKERRKHAPFFHLCYADLCKLRNVLPHPGAKPHAGKNILDLNGDKVKLDEWAPILEALRYDRNLHVICFRSRHPSKRVLEEINTEAKAREVKRRPALLTNFIMRLLMGSLSTCIGRSPTVTCVELDSVPLAPHYMSILCRGISSNTSLQTICLHDCAIQDEGCEKLCLVLRNVPNVKHLDMSGCCLGERSALAIAEMLKYQNLQRFTESWKQSLRYREPDVEGMPGMRRIVLNENPGIGDEGVDHLMEVLKEDVWLKAIDMQDCGVTSEGALSILGMLKMNATLDIVDVRENKAIDEVILHQIMARLYANNANKPKHEYHWMMPKTRAYGTSSCQSLRSRQSGISMPSTHNGSFQSLRSKQSGTSRPNMFHSTQNVALNGLCNPVMERSKSFCVAKKSVPNASRSISVAKWGEDADPQKLQKRSSSPAVCSRKSSTFIPSQKRPVQLDKMQLKLKEVTEQLEHEVALREKAESKHEELNIKFQELEKELQREKSLKVEGFCLMKVEAYEAVLEVFRQFTAFVENFNETKAVRQTNMRRTQSAHVERVVESTAESQKGKYKSFILEVDSSRSSQDSSHAALVSSSEASSPQSQEELLVSSDGDTNRHKTPLRSVPSLSKVQQIFENLVNQSPLTKKVSQTDASGDSMFYPLQPLQPPAAALNLPKGNWTSAKEDLEGIAEECISNSTEKYCDNVAWSFSSNSSPYHTSSDE